MTLFRCLPLLFAVALTAAGCARGADESGLRKDLQARLDRDVKPGLFEVVAIRREGSGPMPAGESGARRVVVYYNATLQLAQDYTFGGWDQLGASSVAFALGATEHGLYGIQSQNRSGDLVRAYGSAMYEETANGWMPIAPAPASTTEAPNIDGTAPPPRSKQLIDRLAAMVDLPPPGVAPPNDEIIADELARASENIERRVKRREQTFTLATGPEESEYARFGDGLIAAINELAPGVKLRQRHTNGSVDNAWLLARGEADYAIVQGDVAAAALAGTDVFERGGPITNLRAVGGLFPEAIHVVVRRDSPIDDISRLRGQRVDIGAPASGTRFDAIAVLAAYGLTVKDLGTAREEGLSTAVGRLQRKQLDALFVTTAAPSRALQRLAADHGLRLLSVSAAAIERLHVSRPGLTPLKLPANTYPNQTDQVETVASAALLLTTSEAPIGEVQNVSKLVFARMARHAGSADVVNVSSEHELRGVTIPLHPGAATHTR